MDKVEQILQCLQEDWSVSMTYEQKANLDKLVVCYMVAVEGKETFGEEMSKKLLSKLDKIWDEHVLVL